MVAGMPNRYLPSEPIPDVRDTRLVGPCPPPRLCSLKTKPLARLHSRRDEGEWRIPSTRSDHLMTMPREPSASEVVSPILRVPFKSGRVLKDPDPKARYPTFNSVPISRTYSPRGVVDPIRTVGNVKTRVGPCVACAFSAHVPGSAVAYAMSSRLAQSPFRVWWMLWDFFTGERREEITALTLGFASRDLRPQTQSAFRYAPVRSELEGSKTPVRLPYFKYTLTKLG